MILLPFILAIPFEDFYFYSEEIVGRTQKASSDIAANNTFRFWNGPALPREVDPGSSPRIAITGCTGTIGSGTLVYFRRVFPRARFVCMERNAKRKMDDIREEWRVDALFTNSSVEVYDMDLAVPEDMCPLMRQVGKVDFLFLTSAVMLKGDAFSYSTATKMTVINALSPYLLTRCAVGGEDLRVMVLSSRASEIHYDPCEPDQMYYPSKYGKRYGTWTWYACTKRLLTVASLHASRKRNGNAKISVMHPGNVNFADDQGNKGTSLIPFGGFTDFQAPPSILDFISAASLEGIDHPCTVAFTVLCYMLTDDPYTNGAYNSVENDLFQGRRTAQRKYVEWQLGSEYEGRVAKYFDDLAKPYLGAADIANKKIGEIAFPYGRSDVSRSDKELFSNASVALSQLKRDFARNRGLATNVLNKGENVALVALRSDPFLRWII
jgi:hypothetical protein